MSWQVLLETKKQLLGPSLTYRQVMGSVALVGGAKRFSSRAAVTLSQSPWHLSFLGDGHSTHFPVGGVLRGFQVPLKQLSHQGIMEDLEVEMLGYILL